MAVAAADSPILVMDAKFRALVATDLPTAINSVPLGIVVATHAVSATSLYIPPTSRVGHDMMSVWFLAHAVLLVFVFRGGHTS